MHGFRQQQQHSVAIAPDINAQALSANPGSGNPYQTYPYQLDPTFISRINMVMLATMLGTMMTQIHQLHSVDPSMHLCSRSHTQDTFLTQTRTGAQQHPTANQAIINHPHHGGQAIINRPRCMLLDFSSFPQVLCNR